jgi:hydrogenase-4 component B
MPADLPTLDLALAVAALWLALGLAGIVAPRNFVLVSRGLFPIGAGGGVGLAIVGTLALAGPTWVLVAPLGLPDLPFHLRLDPLAGFFLVIIGIGAAGVSTFSAGYFRRGEGTAPGLLCLQYHVFLASMTLVVLADDAYLFMVAWETMAIASFFLVTSNHRIGEIRRAGYLYLLIAHIGALGILLAFGVMQPASGDYTFAAMRNNALPDAWAAVAFGLALFGFGAKAGLLPLHVWLPEAHPAAPSPVSALMSGVMLKTAIYGIVRVSFDLLPHPSWWWGVFALVLGLATALFGVMFSAVQTDMKRLLAYSSIENVGVIVTGIGLALVFLTFGIAPLAALALAAALYHSLNHACFKSLLFLTTGSVLHATGERNLGRLGGLIHPMPKVATLALLGALAAASLPPLNAFVSEWLLLQAFLHTPEIHNSYINMLTPLAAAAFVLAAALAAYVMVKFYGVIFLGQPREERLEHAHDAGRLELLGMGWLGTSCVLLGVLPVQVMLLIDHVTAPLTGVSLREPLLTAGWLFLTPSATGSASYSPLLFLVAIVSAVLLTFLVVKRVYHLRFRRADAWDCGFPAQTARMQDTAEGFGQPIKQIFAPFFRIEREAPSPFDRKPHYRGRTDDRLWYWLYLPIGRLTSAVAARVAFLQLGRIHIYLIYSFVTLLILLVFVT